MRETALAALARLDAHLPLDAPVGNLPVAQRQIVAICRGLAANARLLFMDEPTASLTRHEVDLLLATVRRLKAQGVAIVFVSHRLEEVVEIAERVTVLRDGRKVGTFPASEIDDHRLAELMTGKPHRAHGAGAALRRARQPVLEVRGAGRAGEFEDVSFALHAGEIVGLIGLLGAGRTELALALFGMTPARTRRDSASMASRCGSRSNRDAIAAGIAYVSEDRLVARPEPQAVDRRQYLDHRARPAVEPARWPGLAGAGAAWRRAGSAGSSIKAPSIGAPVQTLSGGNQQRVVLAKWLATKPKVLILDSPTVGVDIRNKQGIYD